jgi:hypothetical protein
LRGENIAGQVCGCLLSVVSRPSRRAMIREPSLDALWNSVRSGKRAFEFCPLSELPEAARRYLEYAIAPGTHFQPGSGVKTVKS